MSRASRNLYQIHFYDRTKEEQKHTTLPHKLHSQNCDCSSLMSLVRFNFQNNHGNPSLTAVLKVVQKQPPELLCKKGVLKNVA